MFKLSVTSGNMVAYVLVCQLASVPAMQRHLLASFEKHAIGTKLLLAVYSIWNLDFFGSLYTDHFVSTRKCLADIRLLGWSISSLPDIPDVHCSDINIA